MKTALLTFIICGVLVVIGVCIQIYLDSKRDFNNGVCKYCGTKLSLAPIQGTADRLYWCTHCGYWMFVYHKSIDKKFLKELKEERENDSKRIF